MEKVKEFDVMRFLNEVKTNYPKAISMASGRPDANYFNPNYALGN